jgi:hypothetical protein
MLKLPPGKAAHCSIATTGNVSSNIFFYRPVPQKYE